MARPVTIVSSGGYPVINTSDLTKGEPMTPVALTNNKGAFAITLVTAGAEPVVLINEDNSLWSE